MTGATDSNCDQGINETQDKKSMKEITEDRSKSLKNSGTQEVVVNGHIDETPDLVKDDSPILSTPPNTDSTQNDAEKSESAPEMEKAKEEESGKEGDKEKGKGEELLVLQDSGFNVTITAPGIEPFELPVSSMELVQEIYQVLIDREDTCHRTCFTLQLDGVTLDNFAELKTIEGMKEGSVIKVVEEPYTAREARIHVRHVRDLLKSVDDQDAYLGVECNSLSYLNTVCGGNLLDKKSAKSESVDCTPPDYIMPGSKDRPITALHPIAKDNKVPQCVKVLTYSGWNPPPGPRRLHGDLLYLHIVTVEEKRYHVTSSTRGFYINQSSQDEFNPRPAAQKHLSHSLIDLLNQISPAFKKNFQILLKKRSQKHPFERVVSPYQVHSWLSPNLEHNIDAIRGEDAFSSRLGYEEHIPGQTRDWNEELQTTRELPRKLLPERLVRERAIFKVHSDFVVAATRGAAAVIDGNIMAINPGEESKMQMFLWNNIFFSLGFDVKDHYKDFGGDAAAYAAPGSDLQGVKAYTSVDAEGLYTLGTVIVDYKGYRVTAQSIIPGILEREQEQSVVYGSIDFGKTVVSSEKYKELLQKTAQALKIRKHTVINEKGEEVELLSSVECKGIVGNDSRHYVLDLLRTFPPDANFLPVEGEELNEGSRVLGYPRKHRHKLVCLRQELVDAFVENRYVGFVKHAAFHLQKLRVERLKEQQAIKDEAEKKSNETEDGEKEEIETEEAKKMIDELTTDTNANRDEEASREIVQRAAQAVGSLSKTEFNVTFNPDVFQPLVKHAEDKNEILAQEKQLVKDAAEFLLVHQIPTFIRDCLEHTSSPIDGYTLTDALHHHGINVRYLGKVTEMLTNYPQLCYLRTICVVDMLTRVSKRLFKLTLQSVETSALSASVAHFLNCLLGSFPNPHTLVSADELQSNRSKRRNRKKNRSPSSPSPDALEWANETGKSLWKKISDEMKDYFNFTLNCEGIDAVVEQYGAQKVSLLRGFCKSVGVQLLLRDYNMDSRTKQAFTDDDVLNVFPCVKHIHPKASDAYHVFTTGQAKIQQGVLREGYELINEALNLLNNVYGAMHPEIAACARLLARLNYIMGDYAEALVYQQRAVLMSERVLGIDHPNTITEYAHLALYSFANQQIPTALKLMYRARYLALLCHGENHPEVALFDSNIGLILHAVGQFDLSMRFLLKALELNTKFFGPHSLKVALSFHLVARTYSCLGDFRTALQNEKEAYSIYKQQLGDEHERTKESSECLRHLTQQAVKFQKTMNQLSKGEKVLSLPPLQIQTPTLSNVLETLNHINGIVFVHISNEDIERFKEEMIRRQQTAAKSETGEQDGEKDAPANDGTTVDGATDTTIVNGTATNGTNSDTVENKSPDGTLPEETTVPDSPSEGDTVAS